MRRDGGRAGGKGAEDHPLAKRLQTRDTPLKGSGEDPAWTYRIGRAQLAGMAMMASR